MSKESRRQNNFFEVCSRCGGKCCIDAKPPLTLKRKQIIEKYLKAQGIPIGNVFVQTAYVFPREEAEKHCVFYNKKTGKCIIHPVKPETCVAGPVTFDINIRNQKIEWYLKKEKICPLAGKLYKNKQMLQKHLKSAKKEVLRLVRELDSGALKAILKIEELETFKIDEDNIEKQVLNKLPYLL